MLNVTEIVKYTCRTSITQFVKNYYHPHPAAERRPLFIFDHPPLREGGQTLMRSVISGRLDNSLYSVQFLNVIIKYYHIDYMEGNITKNR